MIKLLHMADLHIGMENYGRIDPATGMHSRLLDYLARLDEAIDYGLAEGVDAVLIAGAEPLQGRFPRTWAAQKKRPMFE